MADNNNRNIDASAPSNDGEANSGGEGVTNQIEEQPPRLDAQQRDLFDMPAPPIMELPVFPRADQVVDAIEGNIVQQAMDANHPSFHSIRYQQMMLENLRLVQPLLPDPTLQQFYLQNSAAAAGGMPQVPTASILNNTSAFNFYPTFPTAASFAPPTLAYEYDPTQYPERPLEQEDDYEPDEEMRKPYGQRCLLYLVDERHWVEALQRISTHPQEVLTVGMQGRAPIHLACDHDAPAFLVHALLNVWPEGAFTVGTSYMNPLHITCSSRHASNEIVTLLLSGCGNPLRITGAKDVDGDTPLHAACRCAAPIDVLSTLVQTNPSVVKWHDFEGLNPLIRLWVRYYVTLGDEVISNIQSATDFTPELVEAWQKSLLLLRVMNQIDKNNALVNKGFYCPVQVPFRAVHCASAVECPRCVLRISTLLYPDQLLVADEDGLLPLHIATKAPVYRVHDLGGETYLLNDALFDEMEGIQRCLQAEIMNRYKGEEEGPENPLNEPSVVDILLSQAPSAARIPEPSGRLPLHTAISRGKAYWQGIQGLIETYPASIEIPDPETKLYPFMLAATAGEGKNNVSTIFELMRLNPELVKMGLSDEMNLKPKAKPKVEEDKIVATCENQENARAQET